MWVNKRIKTKGGLHNDFLMTFHFFLCVLRFYNETHPKPKGCSQKPLVFMRSNAVFQTWRGWGGALNKREPPPCHPTMPQSKNKSRTHTIHNNIKIARSAQFLFLSNGKLPKSRAKRARKKFWGPPEPLLRSGDRRQPPHRRERRRP